MNALATVRRHYFLGHIGLYGHLCLFPGERYLLPDLFLILPEVHLVPAGGKGVAVVY